MPFFSQPESVSEMPMLVYTFEQFITEAYLPFCRRRWNKSTAHKAERIIKMHLLPVFGPTLLNALRRRDMQDFLDRKTLELSPSTVAHLKWILFSIFRLAMSDGQVVDNAASDLKIPKKCQPDAS